MNLLSANDCKRLSEALRRMEEITLTRTLGDTELTVCVKEVGKAWTVAMVVQVSFKRGRMEWVQTVESVEKVIAITEKL